MYCSTGVLQSCPLTREMLCVSRSIIEIVRACRDFQWYYSGLLVIGSRRRQNFGGVHIGANGTPGWWVANLPLIELP